MRERNWYCPAMDREIDEDVCREYLHAGRGGSEDTQKELERWLRLTRRYADLGEFHKICAACAHGTQG